MKIDCDLMKLYYLNHSTHEPWHSIFIVLYTILIITAFLLNSLVLYAVFRRSQRPDNETHNNTRTRNILIGYLCTLDILLTFSMPWTAVDALTKFWPFGTETQLMCQVTKSASAAAVFSSSMMIIVIAIDSYRQIVHASGSQLTPGAIFKMTPIILSLAFAMAFPIFYHTRLMTPYEVSHTNTTKNLSDESYNGNTSQTNHLNSSEISGPNDRKNTFVGIMPTYNLTNAPKMSEYRQDTERCEGVDDDGKEDWMDDVVYCVEDWEFGGQSHTPVNRIYYSLFSLTAQYSIPFITISILYFLVYLKLRKLSAVRHNMMSVAAHEARRRDNKRERRTNRMLITISIVFCFCWLPLNLIGTLMDYDNNIFGSAIDTMNIIFMSCHIVGMCSACINPVIYGFCNETIRTGNILQFNFKGALGFYIFCLIEVLTSNQSVFFNRIGRASNKAACCKQ